MKCPHCSTAFHDSPAITGIPIRGSGKDWEKPVGPNGGAIEWRASGQACPACFKPIILIAHFEMREEDHAGWWEQVGAWASAFPRNAGRPKAALEVPDDLAEDFNEACLVLSDSPKASAALSRRCLQGVLRSQSFNQKDLAPAIQAALDSNTLPSSIALNLDAVRNIGNFAAHPMKDTNSGAVLPVEPEEAEWNLEVIQSLFDLYFVQPALATKRRNELNAKLLAAGKPPMKN